MARDESPPSRSARGTRQAKRDAGGCPPRRKTQTTRSSHNPILQLKPSPTKNKSPLPQNAHQQRERARVRVTGVDKRAGHPKHPSPQPSATPPHPQQQNPINPHNPINPSSDKEGSSPRPQQSVEPRLNKIHIISQRIPNPPLLHQQETRAVHQHQLARYDGTVLKLVRYFLNSFAKRVGTVDQRHPVPRVSKDTTQSQSTFG